MAKTKAKATAKKSPPKGESFYSRQKKKMQEDKGKFRSGGDFWTPEIGKNYVRPVPFKHNGEEELYAADMRHWLEKEPFACLGDDCKICEIKDEVPTSIWKPPFGSLQQGVGPQGKVLMNLVIRGKGDSPDRLVKASLAPSIVFGSKKSAGIMTFMDEDDEDFCDPLNPDKGRDFVIEKTKEKQTSYTVRLANSPSELGLDVEGTDLYQYLPQTSNEDYKRAVAMIRDMEDERGRKSKKGKSVEDDEEDD